MYGLEKKFSKKVAVLPYIYNFMFNSLWANRKIRVIDS